MKRRIFLLTPLLGFLTSLPALARSQKPKPMPTDRDAGEFHTLVRRYVPTSEEAEGSFDEVTQELVRSCRLVFSRKGQYRDFTWVAGINAERVYIWVRASAFII